MVNLLKSFAAKSFKSDIALSMVAALIFSTFLCLAGFDANCEKLRQGVLRLHVIANSDSAADQEIKLKIRDEILKVSNGVFSSATNKDEAIKLACQSTDDFTLAASRVLKENGFDCDVKVYLGKSYFSTRDYESFTLPAGEYDAVKVLIGEAKGKNWWCVMFPSMCIPAAEERQTLDMAVEENAAEIAENPAKYQMRFKVVEWYEAAKIKFKKWFCN